jgi:GNAT superfamily N-acetyltransferase
MPREATSSRGLPMKFGLRAATTGDVPHLPGIERSAAKAFLSLPDLAWIADDAVQSEERHRALIENRTAWVATDEGGSPIGFLNGEVFEGCFHILEVAVRLDAQGQGIGRALIDLAGQFAAANELAGLTLTTFRDVPWNEPLYRRLGFRIIENSDLTPKLARILEDEAGAGLPAERRCAMKLTGAR